jgi:hypothetical protein
VYFVPRLVFMIGIYREEELSVFVCVRAPLQ